MTKYVSVREFQRGWTKLLNEPWVSELFLMSRNKPIAKITPLNKRDKARVKKEKKGELEFLKYAGAYSDVDFSYLEEMRNEWD